MGTRLNTFPLSARVEPFTFGGCTSTEPLILKVMAKIRNVFEMAMGWSR
ncbi:MAG: hypothetical protein LIR46_05260 [Bacteroidota bacterium]|nr:hypothetical protein [Bacteroidota bacterium]